MTTMTSTTVPAGEWTLIYTSEADDTDIGVANLSSAGTLRIRIDASAAVDDAETEGHVLVQPSERASFGGLADGDKVLARPVGDYPARVTVWA